MPTIVFVIGYRKMRTENQYKHQEQIREPRTKPIRWCMRDVERLIELGNSKYF